MSEKGNRARVDAKIVLATLSSEDPAHGTHSLLVHADLGKSYAELGQVDRAMTELTLGYSTDRSGEIHYQLYLLYQKQGQDKLAQEALAGSDLRDYGSRMPRTVQAHLGRAAQLGRGGQTEQR